MSLMKIYSNTLDNIANAIRFRRGTTSEYYPREMPTEINRIVVNRLDYMYGVLNNNQFCGNRITSMENAFYGHNSLSGNAVCGTAVYTMSNAYAGCTSLSNAYCGPSVTNMQNCYAGCTGLKGNAEAVEGVVDMRSAYYGCTGLINAVCPNSVINFASTYGECSALTCEPICGPLVTNMYQTYKNCTYLGNGNEEYSGLGKAVIGPLVENAYETYYGCRSIKIAVIGDPYIDYYRTYYGCTSLTEIPPICASNTVEMFMNCTNLKGIPYIESEIASQMFAYCTNLKTMEGGSVGQGFRMFFNCKNLNTESFIIASDMTQMYSGAGKIADDLPVDVHRFSSVEKMGLAFENGSGRFYFDNLSQYKNVDFPDIFSSMTDGSSAFRDCTKLYKDDASLYASGEFPDLIPSGHKLTDISSMYYNTPVYGNFYIKGYVPTWRNCFGRHLELNDGSGFKPWQINIICDNINMFNDIRDEKDEQRIMGNHIAWSYSSIYGTHAWNDLYNVHLYYKES